MRDNRMDVASGVAVMAIIALSGCSEASKFHTKCDSLAVTSRLEKRLNVIVPKYELVEFNNRLVLYLRQEGYTLETSQDSNYLSPPRQSGKQEIFRNIKTIGCNYETIIWSENVDREDQVLITVHSTIFGNSKSSEAAASDLKRLVVR